MSSVITPAGRREITPEDRYARVCKDHPPAELQGLDCPHGHRAAGWLIYDRVKGTVTKGGDVDEDFRRGKPLPMPATAPEYDERRRQMRAKVESSEPAPPPAAKGGKPKWAPKVKRVLDAQSFVTPDGRSRLRIYLVRRELKSLAEPQFRVTWQQDTGEKANTRSGVAYSASDEVAARRTYAKAVARAPQLGWVRPVKSHPGGRRVVLQDIPEAPGGGAKAVPKKKD